MWLFLFHDASVEAAPSEGPPWWFLASIVFAILAAALFTMRLALSSGRRRRAALACASCGSKVQRGWVRCPACGAETARGGGVGRASGASAAIAPHVGPATLEFTKGPLQGQCFTLDRDVTTIGSVDGNTVVLNDTGVSRKHAGIRKVDASGFELADLGSTNGVFVNGEKSARRRLVAGDVIRIGTSEAIFRG